MGVQQQRKMGLVIAMDGPAGSGKSTAARMLAEAEGFVHLNTGAMYRAVAYLAQQGRLDPATQPKETAALAACMRFQYAVEGAKQRFLVAANAQKQLEDVTALLFTTALTERLKPVVNNEAVRHALVAKMRTAAQQVLKDGQEGVVLEGRDIGTVVFPDAYIKYFVHADLDARTRRRMKELESKGEQVAFETVKAQLHKRDAADQERTLGPLLKADDAIDLDTSLLTPQEVLQRLRSELAERRELKVRKNGA